MDNLSMDPVKKNKIKKPSAAALIAAAVAALWILTELVCFFVSVPTAPVMEGVDYSLYENDDGVYTVEKNVTVRFSSSSSKMRFIPRISIIIPPWRATAAPTSPVPLPLATTGI